MKRFSIVLLGAVLLFPPQESPAQRTVRMNLESIIANAGMIVHGTVTNVTQETDPSTHVLVKRITIDVIENFYGPGGTTMTMTMLSGTTAKGVRRFSEIPEYSVGQEIVGMFYPPSSLGLTSPVGMGQGSFTVRTDGEQKIVVNGVKNSQLFNGMTHKALLAKSSWSETPPEKISLSDLTATIRSLVTIMKK